MNKQTNKPEVEEIDCLEAIDSLYTYLDGELNDSETLAKFKHHLSHCKSCYSRSELEGVISERIKAAGKDKAPESLQDRLRDLMDKL
jgi:anti-sigma factor (TIGR02949 family)